MQKFSVTEDGKLILEFGGDNIEILQLMLDYAKAWYENVAYEQDDAALVIDMILEIQSKIFELAK